MTQPIADAMLEEMAQYYRERASEYDEWFERRGRYRLDVREQERWHAEINQIDRALDAAGICGDVLELACGTGIWTQRLATRATRVTAIDASVEMLAINRAKLASLAGKVAYETADLFSWKPARRFDACFFGFWLSHVPLDRLDSFLSTVASAIRPEGQVFFVDSGRASRDSSLQYRPSQDSQLMTRSLNDGRSYTIVKNHFDPSQLEESFRAAGIRIEIFETPTYFMVGSGNLRQS